MSRRTRSPIKYCGGKVRAIGILVNFIPPGVTNICAPFFGGGSFEIHCAQDLGIHVNASDIYEPLCNFWHVLRHYPRQELVKEVQSLHPLGKDEFNYLKKVVIPNLSGQFSPLQRAAAFFAINKASFSGGGMSAGYSGRFFTQGTIDTLAKANVSNIDFDCCDYETAINRQSLDTLCFFDPPYFFPQKSANSLYGENGSTHKDFDHERLYRVLSSQPRRFILTYNNHPFIRELYRNFDQYPVHWSYTMKGSKYELKDQDNELVIVGHGRAQISQMPRQMQFNSNNTRKEKTQIQQQKYQDNTGGDDDDDLVFQFDQKLNLH